MRFAIGLGIAVALGGAGGALAADADEKKTAPDVKLASAKPPVASAAAEKAPTAKPTANVALAVPPVKAKPKVAAPSLVARIDLNRQRMRVTSNGKLVGNWTISSGKFGHETPPGRFRPKWTSKMHYSRKYNNSPMPYSVFFNGGIATHGTTYTSRLGRAASHGCIRLRTANARKFYKLVHRHGYKRTRIVVTGRAKVTRTASRRKSQRRRRSIYGATPGYWNAYSVPRSRRKRHSLRQYDRRRIARHQQRVRRYYKSRRLVFPGDRY
ncbi:MAG: L,D-transpeptidase [Hyphomicrobiaceae bacterium]